MVWTTAGSLASGTAATLAVSNTTIGDIRVVWTGSATGVPVVSGGGVTTWHIENYTAVETTAFIAIAWGTVTSTGSQTVSVTNSPFEIYSQEFVPPTGATSESLDVWSGLASPVSGTYEPGASNTPTQSGDLWLGYSVSGSQTAAGTTSGVAYTGTVGNNALGWDLNSPSGTFAPNWNTSAGGFDSMAVMLLAIVPTAPTVSGEIGGSFSGTNGLVQATVTPNNASTTVTFNYGTTSSYGSSTSSISIGSGTAPVVVQALITGLTVGTTYHFQASAVNSVGTTNGSDATFVPTAAVGFSGLQGQAMQGAELQGDTSSVFAPGVSPAAQASVTSVGVVTQFASVSPAASTSVTAAWTLGPNYRLFPTTNGPSTAVTNTGQMIVGAAFTVKNQTCWLQGFWWWVCAAGQATTPTKMCLWYYGGATNFTGLQYVVPGTTVTSGTLTAGAWNYVPLPTPVQLSVGGLYIVAIGVNGGAYPDTSGYWTSNPSGIVSGPLVGFGQSTSDGGTTWPNGTAPPWSLTEGMNTSGGSTWASGSPDPTTAIPGTVSGEHNFWVDVQVSTVAPTGYSGTYRIWPNRWDSGYANANFFGTQTTPGTEFHLAGAAVVKKIWYFAPNNSTAMADGAEIWDVRSGTLVPSASWSSPAWLCGTPGANFGQPVPSSVTQNGWVYADVSGSNITLPSGDYKVSVSNDNNTGAAWTAETPYYWGGDANNLTPSSPKMGEAPGGIVSGPITVPTALTGATPAYVFYPTNSGGTPPYSDGTLISGQGTIAYGVTLPSYPNLIETTAHSVSYFSPNFWVDIELLPVVPTALVRPLIRRAVMGRRGMASAILTPSPIVLLPSAPVPGAATPAAQASVATTGTVIVPGAVSPTATTSVAVSGVVSSVGTVSPAAQSSVSALATVGPIGGVLPAAQGSVTAAPTVTKFGTVAPAAVASVTAAAVVTQLGAVSPAAQVTAGASVPLLGVVSPAVHTTVVANGAGNLLESAAPSAQASILTGVGISFTYFTGGVATPSGQSATFNVPLSTALVGQLAVVWIVGYTGAQHATWDSTGWNPTNTVSAVSGNNFCYMVGMKVLTAADISSGVNVHYSSAVYWGAAWAAYSGVNPQVDTGSWNFPDSVGNEVFPVTTVADWIVGLSLSQSTGTWSGTGAPTTLRQLGQLATGVGGQYIEIFDSNGYISPPGTQAVTFTTSNTLFAISAGGLYDLQFGAVNVTAQTSVIANALALAFGAAAASATTSVSATGVAAPPVVSGALVVSASAGVSTTGTVVVPGSVSPAAKSTVLAAGGPGGTINPTAVTSVTTSAFVTMFNSVTVASHATVATLGGIVQNALSAPAASTSVSANGTLTILGAVSPAASGSATVVGTIALLGAASSTAITTVLAIGAQGPVGAASPTAVASVVVVGAVVAPPLSQLRPPVRRLLLGRRSSTLVLTPAPIVSTAALTIGAATVSASAGVSTVSTVAKIGSSASSATASVAANGIYTAFASSTVTAVASFYGVGGSLSQASAAPTAQGSATIAAGLGGTVAPAATTSVSTSGVVTKLGSVVAAAQSTVLAVGAIGIIAVSAPTATATVVVVGTAVLVVAAGPAASASVVTSGTLIAPAAAGPIATASVALGGMIVYFAIVNPTAIASVIAISTGVAPPIALRVPVRHVFMGRRSMGFVLTPGPIVSVPITQIVGVAMAAAQTGVSTSGTVAQVASVSVTATTTVTVAPVMRLVRTPARHVYLLGRSMAAVLTPGPIISPAGVVVGAPTVSAQASVSTSGFVGQSAVVAPAAQAAVIATPVTHVAPRPSIFLAPRPAPSTYTYGTYVFASQVASVPGVSASVAPSATAGVTTNGAVGSQASVVSSATAGASPTGTVAQLRSASISSNAAVVTIATIGPTGTVIVASTTDVETTGISAAPSAVSAAAIATVALGGTILYFASAQPVAIADVEAAPLIAGQGIANPAAVSFVIVSGVATTLASALLTAASGVSVTGVIGTVTSVAPQAQASVLTIGLTLQFASVTIQVVATLNSIGGTLELAAAVITAQASATAAPIQLPPVVPGTVTHMLFAASVAHVLYSPSLTHTLEVLNV